MQETKVLVETKGTTGEETTSYWFDLPIDVAEFEEKLGVGAESGVIIPGLSEPPVRTLRATIPENGSHIFR